MPTLNSLFWRILFINLTMLTLSVIIISNDGFLSKTFYEISWFTILIVLSLFFISSAALAVSSQYINPIKKIIQLIDQPNELNRTYLKYRSLPHEIQQLIRYVIKNAQNNSGKQASFHADHVRFNSIIKNMSDGIFITDENGIISLVNQSAMELFIIENEQPIGQSMAEAFRNHHLNDLLSECVSAGQQVSTSFENPMGKTFIHCIATPLDPELPGNILFLIQDLTRIRQLEIVRRDFVSNVSHELRTPLASIKLITETLQQGAIDDKEATKYFIKHMDTEVDNLSQMVEELLELSKIESGRVPLDKRLFNPAALIRSSVERIALQAERAGLLITQSCPENLPNISVDAPRLEQVMVNLLHNAIKFTKPGGFIIVSAYQENGNITFSIKDSGVGIPPKDLDRIFERFYKTDPSRTRRGTGLGLSIARHLVESHHGSIWAESQPGQGSTFFFRIPIDSALDN